MLTEWDSFRDLDFKRIYQVSHAKSAVQHILQRLTSGLLQGTMLQTGS